MIRILIGLLLAGSFLLPENFAVAATPAPDGSVKITSRTVAPGIGLSWGDGVLSYKGRDYPFTFKAGGMFRDVDAKLTAAELSGQVFNLKNPQDFGGKYHIVDSEPAAKGGGTRASMKNQHGVVVDLASAVEGRKFNFGRDGLEVELTKSKP